MPFVLLIISMAASAQELGPGKVELEEQLGIPVIPGDVAGEEPTEDRKLGREFLVAPLPARNPLFGWTIAVPAVWLYKPESSQPGDRSWVTGGAAFYAENESAGAGLFHKMSLGGDRWRVTSAMVTADLRYDFFGIGGEPDRSIPLRQNMDLLFGEGLYGIRPNLYLGLQTLAANIVTSIDFNPEMQPSEIALDGLLLDIDLVNLAPKVVFDTRDNPFYPGRGWLVQGTLALSRSGFGSDVDYERHDWAANRYASVTERGILALRVATQYVGGDAPFFVFPAFGAGSDLRGYQTGTYRDRFLLAAQAEWRQQLAPRWRAVVFAGIGTVSPDFGGWEETLPSGGVGIRWIAAPKNDLSLRLDVAWGRGENEFYVSLGEAF